MTEVELWNALNRRLPEVHWQRIENTIGNGVPDVNGCFGGVDFWIELKVLEGVRKRSFRRPLSGPQCAWLTKRWRAGGACFVMAAYNKEWHLWGGNQAAMLFRLGPDTVKPLVKFLPGTPPHEILSILRAPFHIPVPFLPRPA